MKDKRPQRLEERILSLYSCRNVGHCPLLEGCSHHSDTGILIVDVGAGGFTVSFPKCSIIRP